MLLEKFKQGKEIDLAKAIQKYISNHFGIYSFISENVKYSKIENFINSCVTSRNVVVNLNTLEKSPESMKSYKEQIVVYLNMINIFKTKFNFGNDNVT